MARPILEHHRNPLEHRDRTTSRAVGVPSGCAATSGRSWHAWARPEEFGGRNRQGHHDVLAQFLGVAQGEPFVLAASFEPCSGAPSAVVKIRSQSLPTHPSPALRRDSSCRVRCGISWMAQLAALSFIVMLARLCAQTLSGDLSDARALLAPRIAGVFHRTRPVEVKAPPPHQSAGGLRSRGAGASFGWTQQEGLPSVFE